MSVQASSWAWSVRGLPSHLKLTLLAMADACNAGGYCYPGQDRLADLIECSDRQIRRNIQALAERALIEVLIRPGHGNGRHSNAYQLALPGRGGNRTSTSGRQPDNQDRATGHPMPGNRTSRVGQPDIAMSYEPLVEPSEEPKDTHCALRAPGAGDDNGSATGFDRFWQAWPDGQRKRGRKTALAAWKTHQLEPKADMIIADVINRARHDEQWLRGFAPMPQTYLRGARWEDELTAPVEQRQTNATLKGILALEKFK
ncbi:MAG TPA: helix-turn-helix domain-containing protein [Chromatiaceae bacterium]|nr:helix-turn-helix domain-containing protein [Chromatiaceae bacterium]